MEDIFAYESEVKSYCRHFPVTFDKAKMSVMYTEDGQRYLDFFCGAGALNYGHNNGEVIAPILEYIENNGILHGLDMHTRAKKEFIQTFHDSILEKRNLSYTLLFPGPTGTNAIEAALKIVRKATGRNNVMAFMGSFHGMTLGSLAITSSRFARNGAGTNLGNVTFIPFPYGEFKDMDTLGYLEGVLKDDHSGIEKPAAIFCETVQAEGGVIVAQITWLMRLREICDRYGILLVCDEIQVGCGRTGTFFSFERAGIVPDIITLSKSISGCGMPMSLVLLKPELDCLAQGEHNGTFRGNQAAFVGGKAAIEYMLRYNLLKQVKEKEKIVQKFLETEIVALDSRLSYRGIGLIWGIDFSEMGNDSFALKVAEKCFENRLVIETSGRKGNVLKLLPALTITEIELMGGLEIIRDSVMEIIRDNKKEQTGKANENNKNTRKYHEYSLAEWK